MGASRAAVHCRRTHRKAAVSALLVACSELSTNRLEPETTLPMASMSASTAVATFLLAAASALYGSLPCLAAFKAVSRYCSPAVLLASFLLCSAAALVGLLLPSASTSTITAS